MDGTRLVPLALTFTAVLLAAPNQPPADDGPCEAIDRFALSRLQLPAASLQDLKTQVHFTCSLPKNVALNFLIATVPDPIETHLALWFDRAVESVINAAGTVGFRFQEAWIPWNAALVGDESDIEKRKEIETERKRREKEPGVLLFRNSAPCTITRPQECQASDLVVLLVPETPTGGIQPEVFTDATEMIFWASSGASQAAAPKIPVMGPSFSGSFASLEKVMQHDPKIKDRLRVISGTSGSPNAWKKAFDEKSESLYSTTVNNLDTQFDMLSEHIIRDWKKGSRLALLTETETGLGFYTTPKLPFRDGPLIFRYPFEISLLRNAYGDEVLKTVVGAQPQPVSFRNLLGFRLFDVGPGTDSTPVLAKNQTPLSQEAVLGEIARSLERERVTLAGILATDVFDALFIARYLRDACPDVRLFTFDSDLLYERAAEDYPFDGTLALTTYPSIAPNQAWTNERSERFSFPNRESEGIYNATLALLIRAGFVSKDYERKSLAEYFNPTLPPRNCAGSGDSPVPTGCYVPPVWLTVVARSGYWPLAVMNAPPEATQTGPGITKNGLLLAWPSSDNHPQFGLGRLPRLWQMIFVCIALALGWHLVRSSMACTTSYGRLMGFSHLNVWPDEEGWLARLCYLLVCALTLLAMYALYVAPLISISWAGGAANDRYYVWFAYLLLFVFVVLGAAPLLALRKGKSAKLMGPEKWHFGILCLAVVLTGFFAWGLLRLCPLDPSGKQYEHQEAFFFAFRSLHLNSGVSPVVPLLVLLPAYFLWARVHLTRVQRTHERLIYVPPLANHSRCVDGEALALAKSCDEIDLLVNQPLPLHWWRTAGAFVLIVATYLYMTHPLRSFEYEPFDEVFLVMLSVLYALIFLTWTRFLMVWHQFRLFLEQLERHPLRFAFDHLPQRSAISPLFQFTQGHAEFTMLVAIREHLAELKRLDPKFSGAADKLDSEIGLILTSVALEHRVSRKHAAPLLQSLRQVNDALVDELHRSLWKSGRPARSADKPEAPPSQDILREEVIALQYDDYIQYILRQQRNLLLFAIVGFILSIWALHAYPFEGPRTITTFITFMFIAFAGGVTSVLYQAERNPMLSRITKTTPGKLSGAFFLRVAGYIGVPLITVLGSQFPSLRHFLFSWIQPVLGAVR
jgi:hypothetical protein